jgi:hypothetical protein
VRWSTDFDDIKEYQPYESIFRAINKPAKNVANSPPDQ